MNSIPKGERLRRAAAMRALSDDQRDELIAAAGSKVIDARSRFDLMQRQVALSHEYRKPPKPRGSA